MKNLIFNIGLPRSGSTVLMNILNENPDIYTTGTCPLPFVVDNLRIITSKYPEFIAMDMDVLNNSLKGLVTGGINGWFNSLTNKPNVVSKSRTWVSHLNTLFSIYENPKFIVSLRDLRDVIVSFEKLKTKYPFTNKHDEGISFDSLSFNERIEIYITETNSNLGYALSYLNSLLEHIKKYPNNFFIMRYENLGTQPEFMLKKLYEWLELPYFKHDLNNIKKSDYYEHDTVYRSLVTHKIRKSLEPYEPQWQKYFNEEQSLKIMEHNETFYRTFYPELMR